MDVTARAWRGLRSVGRFAWQQKRWWLPPVVASCLVIAAALWMSRSSSTPFLYTRF